MLTECVLATPLFRTASMGYHRLPVYERYGIRMVMAFITVVNKRVKS
jgi:hypothetical protein